MIFRSFTVAVEFDDLLEITLPLNGRHFDQCWVITTPGPESARTREIASRVPNAKLFETYDFYRDRAHFNKGRAIMSMLAETGTHGWWASLDADTLLPGLDGLNLRLLRTGKLYSMKRKMLLDITRAAQCTDPSTWRDLPVNRDYEFAGYFTVWDGDSPQIRDKPWFSTQFNNASGYDSLFHHHWPARDRVWLDGHVLHIGPVAENWCGRVTPLVGGGLPSRSGDRRDALDAVRKARRESGGFSHERLDGRDSLD